MSSMRAARIELYIPIREYVNSLKWGQVLNLDFIHDLAPAAIDPTSVE